MPVSITATGKVLSETRAKIFMATRGQEGESLITEARSSMTMANVRSSMVMAKASP
jgi:hypothetical protein